MHSNYVPPNMQQQRKPQPAPPPPPPPPADPFILKVLRLPCPSFRPPNSLDWRCDSFDPTPPSLPPSSSLPRASIAIPATMGAVYAGEDFRAAISVSSAVDVPLSALIVKLELQSGARRFPLLDTSDPSGPPTPGPPPSPTLLTTFPSDGHLSFVVSHPLLEPGLHCLVASITYTLPPSSTSPGPQTYAKFFKFSVLPPFTVSAQCHGREDLLWAEVAVTNTTQRPMFLTHVDVTPTETDSDWTVQRVGGGETPTGEGGEGGLGPLPVGTPRLFLFKLQGQGTGAEGPKVGDIGRVSITWRGFMGEKCHLPAACTLSRGPRVGGQVGGAGQAPPLALQVVECPATAVLEKPFTVRVAVINPHAFALQRTALWLMREKMGSVVAMGKSRWVVGRIEGKGRVEVELRLMGIGLGLQKIGGLRVLASPAGGPGQGEGGQAWGPHVMQMDFDGLHQMEILAA